MLGQIQDAFVRGNNTNISTGAPYTETEVLGDWEILTNNLHLNDTTAADALMRVELDLASVDHYCEITIGFQNNLGSGTHGYLGPMVRFSSSAATCYGITGDGTSIAIVKFTAGAGAQIGSTIVQAQVVGDVLRCSVTGGTNPTIHAIYNGTELGSFNDVSSPITTGTRIGVHSARDATGDVRASLLSAGPALIGSNQPVISNAAVMRAATR